VPAATIFIIDKTRDTRGREKYFNEKSLSPTKNFVLYVLFCCGRGGSKLLSKRVGGWLQ